MKTEVDPASLDRVHHIAISVTDVPAAVAWYTGAFRCTVAHQDPTWALLDFENIQLALVIPDQHPPHIAFSTPDASRFGELKTHRDGTRSTYVRDPSANSIEIMAAD